METAELSAGARPRVVLRLLTSGSENRTNIQGFQYDRVPRVGEYFSSVHGTRIRERSFPARRRRKAADQQFRSDPQVVRSLDTTEALRSRGTRVELVRSGQDRQPALHRELSTAVDGKAPNGATDDRQRITNPRRR